MGQLSKHRGSARQVIGTYGCSNLGRIVKFCREPDGEKGPTGIELACPCGERHSVEDPHWRAPRRGGEEVEVNI